MHVMYASIFHCIILLYFFFIDLPLIDDIEGPTDNDTTRLAIGARPISDVLYDLNINGEFAGVVFSLSDPPAGFASCILSCLESLTVDTSGTSITALKYDEVTRRIILNGPASPSQFTTVVRKVQYRTRLVLSTTYGLTLTVSDGSHSVSISLSLTVETSGNRRRRDLSSMPFSRRRLLSLNNEPSSSFIDKRQAPAMNGRRV